MHDGSHEWVLISGTQNALQHALLLSPLLRFIDWLLMSVCLSKMQFQSLMIEATFKSSQVTFIYIVLFKIQIVSKQLHSDNMKIIHHRSIILLNINSPTKQAKSQGKSGKESKLHQVTEWRKNVYRQNCLKVIFDSDQTMIMSKHNQHHQISYSHLAVITQIQQPKWVLCQQFKSQEPN